MVNIEQAIKELCYEQEHRIPDRFPCRAIMVGSVAQYRSLLSRLRQIPGADVVPVSLIFRGDDVLPHYESLIEILKNNSNRWLILPGVSEYLRLFAGSEAKKSRFGDLWRHLFPADTTTGRIILPLYCCETIWCDTELHLMDDRRIQEGRRRFFDCAAEIEEKDIRRMALTVYAGMFREHKEALSEKHDRVLDGVKALHAYWEKPEMDAADLALITDRLASIRSQDGDVSVHVIRDFLSFLQANMPGGQSLSEENCGEMMQKTLLREALAGKSLDEAILSSLNVSTFSAMDICSKWDSLDGGKRELVRLWMGMHQDASYFCHAILGAKNIEGLKDHILHEILDVRKEHPAWVPESQKLVAAMKLRRDEDYFDEVSRIEGFEERLGYLSGDWAEDRRYILAMTGKWLCEDRSAPFASEKLAAVYPALASYLRTDGYDAELAGYMTRYKTHKLANTLPEDDMIHFGDMEPETYDYRHAVLSSAMDGETFVLWVDALGAEWLPILLWILGKVTEGNVIQHAIARANLPSETTFNEQWKEMQVPNDKLNGLDKLAHKGVVDDPDYYACVEEQLGFFDKIGEKVTKLLKYYNRVIVTGDHGTSRLAARFFHHREGWTLAKGKVMSHGRYALVPEDAFPVQTAAGSSGPGNQVFVKDAEGNRYVVFKNYDHFKQSGFATAADDEKATYGEIHGGGTPEEMLVSVVVVERKSPLPLTAKWDKNPVKIFMRKAKTAIRFSQPVYSIQARINDIEADIHVTPDKKLWKMDFPVIKGGIYPVTLVADGRIVSIAPLVVESAMGNAGGDLP